jgi:tRNA (guanine-N7-)-methyltransferase
MITRKRKKFKFAHFNAWPNCFTHDPKNSQQTRDFLERSARGRTLGKDLVVELAAGTALFSVEMAKRNPDKHFVAIDIKSDRLYTGAKLAQEEKIDNVTFVRGHINELEHMFEKDSVDTVWLTFPDPFPRKRSAKHRLTHPTFLCSFKKILKSSGEMKFKTDNRELFLWSLEQLVSAKWYINELSFDLHESTLPEDYKIMTSYEQRFTKQDIPINFATLSTNQK